MDNTIFVGSCDSEGGILLFNLGEDGKLQLIDRTPLDRPMYLCNDGNRLYALLREPYQQQSGVAEFQICDNKKLKQIGTICPTHGSISCHILSFGGYVYTANYLSGSVTRLPDRVMAYSGKGKLPQQDCSHPHCLTSTPDGQYICICDLGADFIYICNKELSEIFRIHVKPGSGPRHLIFSPDGKYAYCSNELSSEVSIFSYQDGKLNYLSSELSIPDDFIGTNYPSAIRLNASGSKLYVANRGNDSVCIWNVEGANLTRRRFIRSGGTMPREMNVIASWVLCGNSECLTVLSEETGEVTDRIMLKNPWCILPIDI